MFCASYQLSAANYYLFFRAKYGTIFCMNEAKIEKLAHDWIVAKTEKVDTHSDFYCQTRDVFQAKLDKMLQDLLDSGETEENAYIVSAIVGEIGNNSFDHNIGNWRDIPGVFFAYDFSEKEKNVGLADRGQGVFATLKRVKPELSNDLEALKAAFTERITGRAPENRGNGLKFVRDNVERRKMRLVFSSGNARAKLNENIGYEKIDEKIEGCLAILSLKTA